MLPAYTVEIPDNYSSPDLEPNVFDAVPVSAAGKKRIATSHDNMPKNMTELYAFAETLPDGTMAAIQQSAKAAFAALDETERQSTSVVAICLQMLLERKQAQEFMGKMKSASVTAAANRHLPLSEDLSMTQQPSQPAVRRVVRKVAATNPLDSLRIPGLSEVPYDPTISLLLAWSNPVDPDEQQSYSGWFHWVELICEGDNVVQIVAVRDRRHDSPYDAPAVPFNAALPATLTIDGDGATDTFGVMSGVFQFEFGVFDFCIFLVAN